MDEQKFAALIEKAETEEEVISLAREAGMKEEEIRALIDKDDELQENELENVSGGVILSMIISHYAGKYFLKKIKKIREDQYRRGYDSEIMSDNRLEKTCER